MTDDYGPGGANGLGSPVYDRPIPVRDAMVGTLGPERKPNWKKARDQALTNWELPFDVQPYPEDDLPYKWTLENVNAGLAITDILPGAILLVRLRTGTGETFGGWVEAEGGGIAAFSPNSDWADDSQWRAIMGQVGHEVGHCLGFNHGGRGIMLGALRPDDTDLALARDYYL